MGTTSEKLTYLSGTKDKLKTVINAMGGEIDDDTFRSYPETLNDLVLKSINGEIDLFDEYPKKQSTGTNITIDGSEEGKALIELNPSELSQATIPTSDIPVPIKKVTGNNSITLCGKNLFNINGTYYTRLTVGTITIVNNSITVTTTSSSIHQFVFYNIPVTVGKQITISYESLMESVSNTNNGVWFKFSETPETTLTSYNDYTKINKTNKYVTTTATQKYLTVGLRTVPSNTTELSNLQVKYGSATTYEAYQGQTYPINLVSLEYCKIGNYSDEFYLDNGNWYVEKNTAKIDSYNGETITTQYISTTGGLDIGATVYYGLSTPTYIPITDSDLISQLDDLNDNIKSYKGQTNIIQTNEELPFEITISALKELDI